LFHIPSRVSNPHIPAVQILLLGLLVFNTLDRVGGGSLNLPPPDWLVTLVD
jgi:hypothetical protein